MFHAILLICVIGDADNCIALHDQWGPYQTKEECVERIYQMGPFVSQYMPQYRPVKYRCEVKGRAT